MKKKKVTLTGYKGDEIVCTVDVTRWTPIRKWNYKRKMQKKYRLTNWSEIEILTK